MPSVAWEILMFLYVLVSPVFARASGVGQGAASRGRSLVGMVSPEQRLDHRLPLTIGAIPEFSSVKVIVCNEEAV